ncbi:MAG: CarD family transcriptional regulator [Butyricicoccaceae bacterium]
MFQKGKLIVYGNTGVCRVDEIGTPQGISDTEQQYYTLTPLFGSGTIYIPVDSPVFMRPVLTHEQVDTLIEHFPQISAEGYAGRDMRTISDYYRSHLQSHKCEDLVHVMKALYTKSRTLARQGKRLGSMEEQYKKRAEELLYGEFSVALDIPYEEVEPYIKRRIEQMKEA